MGWGVTVRRSHHVDLGREDGGFKSIHLQPYHEVSELGIEFAGLWKLCHRRVGVVITLVFAGIFKSHQLQVILSHDFVGMRCCLGTSFFLSLSLLGMCLSVDAKSGTS